MGGYKRAHRVVDERRVLPRVHVVVQRHFELGEQPPQRVGEEVEQDDAKVREDGRAVRQRHRPARRREEACLSDAAKDTREHVGNKTRTSTGMRRAGPSRR